MSLDAVWDKYGADSDTETVEKEEPIKKTVAEPVKQTTGTTEKKKAEEKKAEEKKAEEKKTEEKKTVTGTRTVNRARVRTTTGTSTAASTRTRTMSDTKASTKTEHSVGVFGEEDVVDGKKPGKGKTPGKKTIDWSALKHWPWIDIVCIAMTVVMVVYVLIHFEAITSKLFNCFLLPVLSKLTGAVIFLTIIAGVLLYLRGRAYDRRGYRRR